MCGWVFCVFFLLGSLPSIEEQKEWIAQFIIGFDPIPNMPAVPVQPFADIIAKYIGVLPKKEDFGNDEQFYDKIQNLPFFSTYYRISGPGKNENGIQMLKQHSSFDFCDSIENQSKVAGISQKDLTKQLKIIC